MANPKFFRFPFAATGDKETIPDEVQTSGALSYAEGFGLDYERDPTKDTKAKRMPRDGTNQVLYDATSNIQQYQLNGAPFWYDASNNGGAAIQYQKNAMVRYADETQENVYISLKDNNTDKPTVETSWFLFAPYDATLLSNLSVAPFVPVISMTLTTPPATPTTGQLYLVPNNATGAWANKNGMIAEWNSKKWLFASTNEGHVIGLPDGRLFTKTNGAYVEKIALDTQSGKWNYAEAAGSANALTATLNPAPSVIVAGMIVQIKVNLTNTAAATLNLNNLSVYPLKRADGTPLSRGDIRTGQIINLVFDGSAWRINTISSQFIPTRQSVIFAVAGASTWTVPENISWIKVRAWGGGGGGGGSNNSGEPAAGSAGGGGGYSEGYFEVTPKQILPITVGAGGTKGGMTGTSGGTSSVSNLISATGGGYGTAGVNGVQNTSFGAGGKGVGGSINRDGNYGSFGFNLTSTKTIGGIGGGTFSGASNGGLPAYDAPPGITPGGGGGGGANGGDGGAGATGLVIIEY